MTLRAQNGIDKISLILDGRFFNPMKLNRHSLDHRNTQLLYRYGKYVLYVLNSEYFCLDSDYYMQIGRALYQLIESDYIQPCFLRQALWTPCSMVYRVSVVEFYFDFPADALTVYADEYDENSSYTLFRYIHKGVPTDTYYSPDKNWKKGKRSTVCCYNKAAKDMHDRHISFNVIREHPYPLRLEFRLQSKKTRFLTLEGLKGTYFEILERYSPILRCIYNRYCQNNMYIEKGSNKLFDQSICENNDFSTIWYGRQEQLPREKDPHISYLSPMAARERDELIRNNIIE